MNLEQAAEILEKALNVANMKGVFGLQDSAVINTALITVKDYLGIVPQVVEAQDGPGVEKEAPTNYTDGAKAVKPEQVKESK